MIMTVEMAGLRGSRRWCVYLVCLA